MPRRKPRIRGELQLSLFDFFYEPVPHVYIPMRKQYSDRFGLSEREIKRRLEKQGYTVWRGELVGILRHARYHPDQELYPNVRKKYELMESLMHQLHPDKLEHLQYLNRIHHGIPDYLCYRQGRFLFVECKLCHEQLSARQKVTIRKLQALGFAVEVHKLVDHQTKARRALVGLETNRRQIEERQLKLTKRLAATI